MKDSQLFYKNVELGEKGLAKGISFSHKLLNKVLGGITKNSYFLILGKSKSGKSSFLYDQFMFNVIDQAIEGKEFKVEDVEIYVYSFEISSTKIYAKAAARRLFLKHGIVTSPKEILGLKGPADDRLYKYLYGEDMKNYLAIVDSCVNIMTSSNPKRMYSLINEKCTKQSKIVGKDSEGKEIYQFINPNKKFIVAVDHMSLVELLKGTKLKETVDLMSDRVMRALKEKFPITTVLIQQITPPGEPKLYYGHQEARDSKNTFQDCDVCLSINSPYHEDFEAVNFAGGKYYITPAAGSGNGIGDNLRLLSIEKDRLGNSGYRVPAGFIGQMGVFKSIDPPKTLDYEQWKFKNTYDG